MRPITKSTADYQYAIVGGGLQAGLLALAIRHYQPESKVLIVERSDSLGGNHTWSCHETDLTDSSRQWMGDLPSMNWPSYFVQIGDFHREVQLGYRSFRSVDFHECLMRLARATDRRLDILLGQDVREFDPGGIWIGHNRANISAECVIDCRGSSGAGVQRGLGFQKFFGWEVQLSKPWYRQNPVLMDADPRQDDGFRFTYSLPFPSQHLLLQDTYFSNTAELDFDRGKSRLTEYLSQHGHDQFSIVREEHGCLPMPYRDEKRKHIGVVEGGVRGGIFHAATGYSLPLAIRYAEAIASVLPSNAVSAASSFVRCNRFQARYSRFLNRMLFCLVAPQSRRSIFRRFYQSLPDALIGRFYAHRFSRLDALRILAGKPPGGLTPIRFFQSYMVNP